MLEQLGMIGVSWRQGGAQSIAEFSLDESGIEDRLREFAEMQDLAELGYLATCNRVELIYTRRQASNGVDLRPQAFELLRCDINASSLVDRNGALSLPRLSLRLSGLQPGLSRFDGRLPETA